MRVGPQWRAVASLSAAHLSGLLFTLFVLVVTARLLGPEGRGTLAAALSWSLVFATAAGLSLGPALTHRMQHGGGAVPLATHVGTLAVHALAAGAFGVLLFLISGFSGAIASLHLLPPGVLVLSALLIPLLLWEPYATALSARAGVLSQFARTLIAARATGAAFVVVLLFPLQMGLDGAILAVAGGQLLLAGLSLRLLSKAGGFTPRWREFTAMLPAALKFHVTTVAAMAIDAATVLLVFRHLGPADAGHYQLAQQMVAFLLFVPLAAGAVLHSRLSSAAADADWPAHRRFILQVCLLVGVAAAVAWLAAPVLVPLIGGQAFAPAIEIFRSLLPSVIGPTLAVLLAPQWIGRGVFAANALLTVAVAIALLVLTHVGIQRDGLDGAVHARLLTLAVLVPATQLLFFAWVERQHRRYRAGFTASTIKSP